MLKYKFFILALFVFNSIYSQNAFLLQEGSIVKLTEGDKAKQLLMTEDEYTNVLSKFDLQSKTQRTDNVTLNDYLKYSAEQVLNWSDEEKKIMGEVVSSVSKKIESLGLKLKMPDTIYVMKSTMENEGGAVGYTRGAYIVLNQNTTLSKSTQLENLFIHELFHVVSRYDADMRDRIYNTIGFKKCNEVAYPYTIADLRISNPDAPLNNYYITVEYDAKPVDVMLILFASKSYNGGSFFSYLRIGLLAVEGDGMNKQIIYRGNKPMILKTSEVNKFYEQVGKNTDYIFHAEEISADHFELLLNQDNNLPNPEIIEAMKNVMR